MFQKKMLFSDISNFVKETTKSEVVYNSLNKEYLVKIVNDNINSHNAFLSTVTLLNDDEKSAMLKMISKNANTKKYDFILAYRKKLNNNAYNLEVSSFLKSIIVSSRVFINLNKDILANIDKVIQKESISIFDTKISTYAFIGILKQSEVYGFFSQYFFSLIMNLCNQNNTEVPKYRVAYLKKYFVEFVHITNEMCNTKGKYGFIKDLEIVEKKGINFQVYSSDNTFSLDSVANVKDYPSSVISSLIFVPTFFNIFALAGEALIKYQYNKINKIKDTKEWLETRVALLKMDMNGVDKDDPEYIRTEKIVAKYDDMIIKYDKKINDYLES